MNKLKKKLALLICWTITMIILTSCKGSRELDEIGIVVSMGMDIEDEKIIMTVEIINPTSTKMAAGAPEQRGTVFIQSIGDTISDAGRNTTLQFDRRMYLPHNSVVIFGEEFAKRGIGDFMDFFSRDNEERETSYMVVAKGAKAYEVMGINGGLSNSAGDYLVKLIENFKRNAKTRSLPVFEFFRYYYDTSTGPILGVVEKVEKKEINKETSKQITQETKEKVIEKYVLDVSGGAAFKEDILIGYYSGDEMIGFNFIVDELEEGLMVFETPKELSDKSSYIGREGRLTVMEILKSKTKKDIKIIDGEIQLAIDVKLRGGLREETRGVDLSNSEIIEALEKACSEKVKEHIKMTMEKAQKEFKHDNFSIGALIHRKYPEEWRKIYNDWQNIFPKISYTVNVETEIQRTGLVSTPSNIRER